MRRHKRHRISEMMKRAIVVVALCGFLVSPKEIGQADAQIFIMSDEEYMNNSRLTPPPGYVPILPQGGQEDWIYAPLGDGLLLLLGLGGAYWMGRRRKKR